MDHVQLDSLRWILQGAGQRRYSGVWILCVLLSSVCTSSHRGQLRTSRTSARYHLGTIGQHPPSGLVNSSTSRPRQWPASGGRALKEDHTRLLASNGFAPKHLAQLNRHGQYHVIRWAQSNIRLGPLVPDRVGPYAGVCPGTVTLRLVELLEAGGIALSSAVLGLQLNEYLHVPDLTVRTIRNDVVESRVINTAGDPREVVCYYQGGQVSWDGLANGRARATPAPFGTYSINAHGQLRASLQVSDTHVNVIPLRETAFPVPLPDPAKNNKTSSRTPYLLLTTKQPAMDKEPKGHCGTYESGKSWRNVRLRNARLGRGADWRTERARRDIRLQTKWIRLALIMDDSLVASIERNNGDPKEVALSLVNLVDQIFQPLKARIVLSFLEMWSTNKQMHMTSDSASTLLNLMSYASEHLYSVTFDSLQLLTATGASLGNDEKVVAALNTVCTLKSVGIVHVEGGQSPLNLVAIATNLAHTIAHNLGIHHDDDAQSSNEAEKGRSATRDHCVCPLDAGCIMQSSLLGDTKGFRPLFSSCSQDDFFEALHMGQGVCLLSSPFQAGTGVSTKCGDGVVDADYGEECDCGGFLGCLAKWGGTCCDPTTCRFKDGAQCADGPCCTNECKLKKEGSLCRATASDCDLPEYCSGQDRQCPTDGFKKNGQYCDGGKSYCFNRTCQHLDRQCSAIWGNDSGMASIECYRKFNTEGMFNGHCGMYADGSFKACETSDLLCGSVQCQGGQYQHEQYTASASVISHKEQQHECRTRTLEGVESGDALLLLAANGTKCDINKICLAGQCVDIVPLIQTGSCPMSNALTSCSGHGQCSDLNQCSCDVEYTGPDCSRRNLGRTVTNGSSEMNLTNGNSATPNQRSARMGFDELVDNFMIPMIMVGLILFFLLFFLLALFCYRKSSSTGSTYSNYYEGILGESKPEEMSLVTTKPPLSIRTPVASYNSLKRNDLSSSLLNAEKRSLLSEGGTYRSYNGSISSVHRTFAAPTKQLIPLDILRIAQKDAAVSPFIKRKLSSRHNLMVPTSPAWGHGTTVGPDERLSDEWTSISDEFNWPHPDNSKPSSLQLTAMYRETALLTPASLTDRSNHKPNVYNHTPVNRKINSPSITIVRGPASGEVETCDVALQVNLDGDGLVEEDEGLYDMPPPMRALTLTRMMNPLPRVAVQYTEQVDSLWQPLLRTPTPPRFRQPPLSGSPQRRRTISQRPTELASQKRASYSSECVAPGRQWSDSEESYDANVNVRSNGTHKAKNCTTII